MVHDSKSCTIRSRARFGEVVHDFTKSRPCAIWRNRARSGRSKSCTTWPHEILDIQRFSFYFLKMFAIFRKKARHLVVKYFYVVKFIFVYIFNEILTRMCEIRLNATKIHGDVLDFEKIHFFYFFKFRCFYGCLWSVRSRSGEVCRICLKINEKHEFL